MIRKIIVNVFMAFVVLQVLVNFEYIYNSIEGNYHYLDSYYADVGEYLKITVFNEGNFTISVLSLIFFFLPFQIIKDFFLRKNKKLSFFKKCVLFFAIVLAISAIGGSFFTFNMISFMTITGTTLLFNILLYFTLDKYVEQSSTKEA